MGTYANPPDKLKEVGRKLEGNSYDALRQQCADNERLFALYDRGPFKNGVFLCSQEEFNAFESQTVVPPSISMSTIDDSGRTREVSRSVEPCIKREGFFAVPLDAARKLCGNSARLEYN